MGDWVAVAVAVVVVAVLGVSYGCVYPRASVPHCLDGGAIADAAADLRVGLLAAALPPLARTTCAKAAQPAS